MWFTFAIISALCASLSTILEKKVLLKEHTISFSTVLALGTALITLPSLYIYRETSIPLIVWFIFIASSILSTLAYIEVTSGLRHMDISNSAPLFLLSPLLTALLAFIFLGETLNSTQIFGMILLGVGTYILQTKKLTDIRGFLSHLTHDVYIKVLLLGLFLYGITSLFDRIVIHHYNIPPLLSVAYLQIFIALNFILLVTFGGKTSWSNVRGTLKNNLILVLLVIILTVSYRLAQGYATGLAAVGLVVAVKRSSSLFTTVIGGELFHERNLIRKTIACMIMIGGVCLIAFT
jgi:transporter family protein